MDDLGDGVAVARVDLEAAKTDSLVEVGDGLHVLQLEEGRVLETLHQQVVVFLLHDVGILSLHLRLLHLLKQSIALDIILLLACLAIGDLLLTGGVDGNLGLGDLTVELVHVDLELVDFLAQRLCMAPLHFLLLKAALLAELLNHLASLLELLILVGLLLDLLHLQVALEGLKALVELLEVDGVLDDHLLERGFLDVLLAELGLHVFEELAGHDLDVSDFDRAHVHTPASDNLFHLFEDHPAELLPVLDDVVDSRVGDLVANDCADHRLKDVVSLVEVARGQIKVLVRFERKVFIDGPLEHCRHADALHFDGNLLSSYLNLDVARGEDSDSVPGGLVGVQTNTGLLLLSIPYDDDPLVGLAVDSLRLNVLQGLQAHLVEEPEDEEDGEPLEAVDQVLDHEVRDHDLGH